MTEIVDSRKLVTDAKKYIKYRKDKKSKIAYLTLDRPERADGPG